MSTFAFLFVCVQACLLQNVYSQCLGAPYGAGAPLGAPIGLATAPLALASAAPLACGPAYGGAGVGEVAVAGELPVAGATLVIGQVPILGAVEFGGVLPAAGAVTISGSCACGCGAPGPYPGPYYY